MTPTEVFTIVLIGFCFLLTSHIMVLMLGWHLGTKTDPNVLLSSPTKGKTEIEPYHDGPDIWDEATLDTE